MKIEMLATRTCPECENFGLEVSENPNIYECKICGSIWMRLKPLADESGNMINMPEKLKKLLNTHKKYKGGI